MARRFLSTLPVRGATLLQTTAAQVKPISIHAPREGSDLQNSQWEFANAIFLSTLPVRGATAAAKIAVAAPTMSIHAPREGSDGVDLLRFFLQCSYFYPRSP